MIQPVNAFAPKVFFKGHNNTPTIPVTRLTEKHLAIANAGGVSAAAAAATTLIARSYTALWKHAAAFGLGAGLVTMMFIAPKFLYQAGFNCTQNKNP